MSLRSSCQLDKRQKTLDALSCQSLSNPRHLIRAPSYGLQMQRPGKLSEICRR